MAKTTKQVFLPKWYRWLMIPIMAGFWLFITYMEYFNPASTDKLGLVGYLFMTALFWGLGVTFWFMTNGKLPAYIIEEAKK